MGCDIHAMMEAKRTFSWGTYWFNAGDPMIDRNYSLFGLLAGVRAVEVEPISPPRGLPEGYRDGISEAASEEFRGWHENWGTGAHSTSWVTLDELRQSREILPDDEDLADLIRRMERVADEFDGDGSRVRLVFFFDS